MTSFAERAVQGLRRRLHRDAQAIDCNDVVKQAVKLCCDDDDALDFLGLLAFANIKVTQDLHWNAPLSGFPKEGYLEDQWIGRIARLFSRHESFPQLCLQIDRRAVEQFGGAGMSPHIQERAIDLVRRNSHVYVDVRDNSWQVAGANIRMVFIENTDWNERYLAVIELPGGRSRLIQWRVVNGSVQQFQFDHFHRSDENLIALFKMRSTGASVLMDELRERGIDHVRFASEVVQLCRLSVVWVDMQRTNLTNQADVLDRPDVENDQRRDRPKALRMQPKERIRFAYVQPRRERVPHEGGGQPRELSHGHWVTGHFKEQAYGKNHTLRRLLWVDQYPRGPKDKPMPPLRRNGFLIRPNAEQVVAQLDM